MRVNIKHYYLKPFFLLLLPILVWLGCHPGVGWSQEDITSRLQQFNQESIELFTRSFKMGERNNSAELDQLFTEKFDPYLSPHMMRESDDLTVLTLRDAFHSLVSQTHDKDRARTLTEITKEIYKRGLDASIDKSEKSSKTLAQETYGVLVNGRLFDLANEISEAFPEKVIPFPYTIYTEGPIENEPSILVPDKSGESLRSQLVSVNEGRWLVSVVRPGCAFSRQAMAYIEENITDFSNLLPKNTLWVISQKYTKSLPQIENWNRKSKFVDIYVAYGDKSWPKGIRLDTTPGFYLLEDGVILDNLVGWVDDEQAQNFKSMLHEFADSSRQPEH